MQRKIDSNTSFSIASPTGNRKFWQQAFFVYAALEAVFHIAIYIIEYSQCKWCLLPVTFYICRYFLSISLAIIIWYLLGFFYRQPLWKLILGNIAVFLLYYFIYAGYIFAALNSGSRLFVWPQIKGTTFRWVVYGSWFDIGKYVLLLTAFYVLRFYEDYRKAASQRLQLAVLNKDMQLNLLKLQLNPHFYFNTLNNLYGLSRSNNRQLLPALNQLENIMQYVITDCNKPKVLLSEEVQFLRSYVELERLRYEENTRIEFIAEGEINRQQIVPLLLIQFVENAFKHGMKEKLQQNWMRVHIVAKANDLFFQVENSDYGSSPSQGIGINSVQNLLQLQYEGRHTIDMVGEGNLFSVTLRMNLL